MLKHALLPSMTGLSYYEQNILSTQDLFYYQIDVYIDI